MAIMTGTPSLPTNVPTANPALGDGFHAGEGIVPHAHHALEDRNRHPDIAAAVTIVLLGSTHKAIG